MTPLLLLALTLGESPPTAITGPSAPVGRTLKVRLKVAAGAPLEARPHDDRRRPLVVQSLEPIDDGYLLTLYGLDPGRHQLADALRRADGSPVGAVSPAFVEITSGLPAGQVLPHDLPAEPGPRVGGYRLLLLGLGAVWVVGLLGLGASFFLPRRRAVVPSDRPVTLADQLKPLVDGAAAGTLGREELAALERTLVAYWRTRRGWNDSDPHATLRKLHADPEAGPLLAQLEAWLHQPTPKPPADVGALLAPYRAVPADAVPLPRGK